MITLTQSLFMLTATLWWPYWSLFIVELGATKTQLGIVLMLEQSTQLVLQLPGGILADRLGRKKVIVLSSVFRALSPLAYLAANKWYLIPVGMILTQFSSMMMPAVNALIAESVAPENRAAAFGTYRMMTWMPMMFTALIGGMIVDILGVIPGVKFCVVLTLVVACLNVFLRWRYLEDTYVAFPTESRREGGWRNLVGELRTVPRVIWGLIVVASLSSISIRLTRNFMVVYASETISLTPIQWGIITTAVSVVSTVLTIPSGILSDRIGRKPVITVSRVLGPASLLGFTLSHDFIQVLGSRLVGAVGDGFGGTVMGIRGGPAWQALVTDIIPPDKRGSTLGLMGTITGLLSLPATWIGGYLYDFVSPLITFQTGFTFGLVATVLFIIMVKEPEEKTS